MNISFDQKWLLAAGLSMSVLMTGCAGQSQAVPVASAVQSTASVIDSLSENAVSVNAATESSKKEEEAASVSINAAEMPAGNDKKEDLKLHVRGINDFSIIEGRTPDLTAGIRYDETIQSVEADASAANFLAAGSYPIVYHITAVDGQTQDVTIQADVEADLEQYLYGMEGNAIVTVGGSFDPMENVETDEEIAAISADVSELNTDKEGEYLISYLLTGVNGKTQTAVRRILVMSEAEKNAAQAGQAVSELLNGGDYSTVTDLGLWRLTAYMDTPADQGPYVGQTASGAPLVAGRTVAVSATTCSRLGLSFGDKLMIDGHIYVLEDHGGSAMHDQLWVDIFVDNEADEYSEQFNKYAEVYLLR